MPKKPKTGRPALAKNVVRVEFKADARDVDAWAAAADEAGVPLSEWLRTTANNAVAK